MYRVKTKVTPVITGANGTISKASGKYLSNITWKTRHKGTTENSHTGHCTHTAGSAAAQIQNLCL
jgi:hypothetical protein